MSVLADTPTYLSAFPYVRLSSDAGSDTTQQAPISDDLFYEVSRPVIFQVSKWDISDNDSLLIELRENIIPLLQQYHWRLDRIELRGAASPEGPWEWNQQLAQYRSQSLLRKIVEILPDSLKPIGRHAGETHVVEDYPYLVRMMREAGDPYAEEVARLVARAHGDDERAKLLLFNRREGELWQYLLRTYFPSLRSARLVLWMTQEPVDALPMHVEQVATIPVVGTPTLLYRLQQYIQGQSQAPYQPLPQRVPVGQDSITGDTIWSQTYPSAPIEYLYRKEALSIKTNLLLDFAYVHGYGFAPAPNVQLEYYPLHGHITPVVSFDCPWWSYESAKHKYFQVRNYQVEARYYFRKEDARYDGWYLGVYAHGYLFGVGFNGQKGWQGEGWGAGLSAGYVLPFSSDKTRFASHWKAEFGLQVGYIGAVYDPYVYGCEFESLHDYYYDYQFNVHTQFVPRQHVWHWGGPTRINISIVYDLMYRKVQKRGWGFSWREKKEKENETKKGGNQ